MSAHTGQIDGDFVDNDERVLKMAVEAIMRELWTSALDAFVAPENRLKNKHQVTMPSSNDGMAESKVHPLLKSA